MTGSACASNRKKVLHCIVFFESKVHFWPISLVNTKTNIPLRVGAVLSAR